MQIRRRCGERSQRVIPKAKIVNDGQTADNTTFLDNAKSEVAKIGAQGVKGVRVVSARVEGRDAHPFVHLVVDVEYSTKLSDAIDNVHKKARTNLETYVSEGECPQVKVTVAKVLRPTSGLWNKVKNFPPKGLGFLKRELGPWIVPLLFVGLGLAILWAITSWINNKNTTVGDVVLAMLLVLPILIYALISGRLTELKGPGGVEAKFTGVAIRPVAETASHDLVSFDQLLTVGTDEGGEQPRGEKQLAERVRRFTEVQPIVMVITIGSGGERKTSDIESLKMYVAQLARTRNFALVAFLDTKKDFVAYMPSWTIQNRLLDEDKANDLFRVIQEDDRGTLIDYPGVVRDKISPTTTNGEALRKMVTSNLNVIVVVDENNRLKGVVEREQVLTRMMLALTPNG